MGVDGFAIYVVFSKGFRDDVLAPPVEIISGKRRNEHSFRAPGHQDTYEVHYSTRAHAYFDVSGIVTRTPPSPDWAP
jgi:hypothetical protein